jgi:peptidyl-prolyl cis-trans isomerase C
MRLQMTKRLWTPALLAMAALAVAGCNKDNKAATPAVGTKPPVATVNGTPIPAEIVDLLAQGQFNKKPEEITKEQRKQIIDQLVDLYAAAGEAEKEKLADDPEVHATLEFQRLNGLASALVRKYMKGKTPTDADLKAEYERQISAMPKLEYHARHILVKDEDTAKDVIAQLGKGAKFEDLAKKYSIDGSKAQGGDLNWFTPDRMVKPFSEALEKLKKGEYTKEPVKSDFGWHVIKLEDTRPNNPPPFDSVKDRLGPSLQQRMVREYVETLRKQAVVQGL